MRSSEKMDIGMFAASLIEANDCIIIGSGTTVLSLARHIKPKGNLTVITAALNVATELNLHPEIEILVLGAYLEKAPPLRPAPMRKRSWMIFPAANYFLE